MASGAHARLFSASYVEHEIKDFHNTARADDRKTAATHVATDVVSASPTLSCEPKERSGRSGGISVFVRAPNNCPFFVFCEGAPPWPEAAVRGPFLDSAILEPTQERQQTMYTELKRCVHPLLLEPGPATPRPGDGAGPASLLSLASIVSLTPSCRRAPPPTLLRFKKCNIIKSKVALGERGG